MRVSFDIDGVLADFILAFGDLIAEYTSPGFISYPTTEQKEWRFPIPSNIYDRTWEIIDETQNWWMMLDPLVSQKDINAINYTIHNHDVYFITSRKSTTGLNIERQCQYWLDGIGIDASHATVIATQAGKKHQLMNAMDIDCHIDDKPAIVKDVAYHSSAISCVLNQPYNLGNLGQEHRFYSVEEYCEWINK